jgi:two-component sensor histidine kinase
LADDCELVASELTSNVIRAATGSGGQPRYDVHGRLPVLWLRLLSDRARLRLEVWDNLAPELGVPVERQATAADENGRGLELVSALTRDWGWDVLPGGDAKRVWAVLA